MVLSLSGLGSLSTSSILGASSTRSLRAGLTRSSDLRSLSFLVPNYKSEGTNQGTVYVSSAKVQAKMVLGRGSYRQSGYEFVFPFPPIDIQYSGITGQWVDIARPGRTPIVDYAGAQLLQVSFKFLVARPWDGLEYTVDQDLETLRYICSSQNTVTFYGFDGMMTKPFQQPGQPRRRGGGFFFHVIDFSVNSMRRNADNKITAAECTITVQENNNPNISYVSFPPISYPTNTVTPTKSGTTASSPPAIYPGMTREEFSQLALEDQAKRLGTFAGYFPPATTATNTTQTLTSLGQQGLLSF
jgi:hypothetical protein